MMVAETASVQIILERLREGATGIELDFRFLCKAPHRTYWQALWDAEFHVGVQLRDGRTAANTDALYWLAKPEPDRSSTGLEVIFVKMTGSSKRWLATYRLDGVRSHDVTELVVEWPEFDVGEERHTI